VDVKGGRIEVHRRAELGVWKEKFTVEVGGTLSPLAAPNLTVNISALLPHTAGGMC
jgi:Uma2 family endonuclease